MIRLYYYRLQASDDGENWKTVAKCLTFKRRHINRLLNKYNKKSCKEKHKYWRISETYKVNDKEHEDV